MYPIQIGVVSILLKRILNLQFTATALWLYINVWLADWIQAFAALELCQISDRQHVTRPLRYIRRTLVSVRMSDATLCGGHDVYGQAVSCGSIAQNRFAIEID